MIPKYLRFQSFASYKNEQKINFDKLSRNDIFLIHGKTGSGKTSILDAITYVLYGESSGGARGGLESMRCRNYGADTIPTEIEFIFEVKGKEYKFTRSIYDRKKRTGKIETEYECNCYYSENGEFVPYFDNPRKADINQKAVEIIGLTYNQFMQVVILPQGKFESFLVASSKEKEEILNTLFKIDDWNAIGQWICEQAIAMDRTNKEQRAVLNSKIEQLGTDSRENADEVVSKIAEKESEHKQQLVRINDTINVLKKKLEKESETLKLFIQREQIQQKLDKLLLSSTEMTQKEQLLIANANCVKIVPSYERFYSLKSDKTRLETENSDFLSTLEKYKEQLENSNKELDLLENQAPHIQKLREKLTVLKTLEKHYSQHSKAKQAVIADTNESNEISEQLNELKEKNDKTIALKNEKAALREKIISQYQVNLSKLEKEKNELDNCHKLMNDKTQYEQRLATLVSSLEQLNLQITEKEKQIERLKEEQSDKYTLHISFLSKNLASQLKTGEPCPVCGSVHHPSPSNNNNGKNYEKELLQLAETISKLEKERSGFIAKQSDFSSRIEQGKQYIKDKTEALNLLIPYDEKHYNDVVELYNSANEQVAELPKLNDEIAGLDNTLIGLSDEIIKLTKAENDAKAKLSESKALLRVIEQQLDSSIPDITSLKNTVSIISKQIDTFEKNIEQAKKLNSDCQQKIITQNAKLEQNKVSLKKYEDDLSGAEKKLSDDLSSNGFSDINAFLNARLDKEQENKLSDECANYKLEKELCIKEIAKLDSTLKDAQKPDVTVTRNDLEENEKLKERLTEESTLNSEKLKQFKNIITEYDKSENELSQKIEEARRLKYFGQELRGDRGIGLRRYVLGIMLENVIFEANRLLEKVKGGQFRLYNVLSEDSKQTGLDLMIGSNKAESKYSVAALSGGEKFLVAISLSMALSSVVQMQAGGVSIEAMFIDEGFGSLDPTALDEAMEILQNMKGSRRFLGIISHVESMKETIPNKIEVINDNEGSKIEIT